MLNFYRESGMSIFNFIAWFGYILCFIVPPTMVIILSICFHSLKLDTVFSWQGGVLLAGVIVAICMLAEMYSLYKITKIGVVQ